MTTLEQIDPAKPIELWAYQHGDPTKEIVLMDLVDGIPPLTLIGEHAAAFLTAISHPAWRLVFEDDLQGISEHVNGDPVLTTWLPLDLFRNQFCTSEYLSELRPLLLTETSGWEAAGCDHVHVDFFERR